jgi:predicted enzyme related to lactoylglutathione lyase
MRSVVHFEIPVDDLDRAKRFYRTVFDWHLETTDMPGGIGPFTEARTTPVDDGHQPVARGAINGALVPREELTPSTVVTIDVESVDDALADVQANGGGTVVPRTAIPGMGAFAYCTDSEGNVIGLWESTETTTEAGTAAGTGAGTAP